MKNSLVLAILATMSLQTMAMGGSVLNAEPSCSDVVVNLTNVDGRMVISMQAREEAFANQEVPQELGVQCIQEQLCVGEEQLDICDELSEMEQQTQLVSDENFQTLIDVEEVRGGNYRVRALGD